MDLAENLTSEWLTLELQKIQSRWQSNAVVLYVPCQLSLGDFLDRLSILYLKNRKLKSEAIFTQLEGFKIAFMSQPSNAKALMEAALLLFEDINSALWDLEDLGRLRSLTYFQLGKVYEAVQRLNKLRSDLKNHIDTLVKSDFTDEKKYG